MNADTVEREINMPWSLQFIAKYIPRTFLALIVPSGILVDYKTKSTILPFNFTLVGVHKLKGDRVIFALVVEDNRRGVTQRIHRRVKVVVKSLKQSRLITVNRVCYPCLA